MSLTEDANAHILERRAHESRMGQQGSDFKEMYRSDPTPVARLGLGTERLGNSPVTGKPVDVLRVLHPDGVAPEDIEPEVLDHVRLNNVLDDAGNYSLSAVDKTRALLASLKSQSSFWRALSAVWRGIKSVQHLPAALMRTPRVALVWTLRKFLTGSSDEGGLLFRALDQLDDWKNAIADTFDKGVAQFVKDMAFDTFCLAAHLATSDWRGKIFSLVEFAWRQFGPLLKIPIEKVWTNYVWPAISKLFRKNARPLDGAMQANASEDNNSRMVEAMATSAAVVGCLAAGKKVVDNKQTAALVTSWGNLGRDVSNCQRGGSTVIGMCQTFVSWVKEAILFFFPGATLGFGVQGEFEKEGIDICEFIALHAELSEINKRKEMATNFNTFPKCVRAEALGTQIIWALVNEKVKVSASVRSQISTMRKEISEAVKYFEKYIISPPNRRCPFHVQFFGAPGCGKSELMTQAAMEIPVLARAYGQGKVTPADEEDFTYHDDGTPKVWKKGGGCKHDDGYNSELKVMTYDDIFACQGEQVDTSDAVWLLRAVSSMACPMSMADISDKGIEFRCLLMVTSTNSPYPKFNEMRNDQAVWRRRNVLVHVVTGDDGRQGFDLLIPNPDVAPSEPYQAIKRFRGEEAVEDLMVYLAKECYSFLQLPLLGGQRYSNEKRNRMVEKMRANAFNEPPEDEMTVSPAAIREALAAARAGQIADRAVQRIPEPVHPVPVVDVEEAQEQYRRLQAAGGIIERDAHPCACCAGYFCGDRSLVRCQERGFEIYDEDIEQAFLEGGMWLCHRRGILYQGDLENGCEVMPSFIMLKRADMPAWMETVLQVCLHIQGNVFDLLVDMYGYMPEPIKEKFWDDDMWAVWDWSVDQRAQNLHDMLQPDEEFAPMDDVMRANADEEIDHVSNPSVAEKLASWAEERWNAFCAFIHQGYLYSKDGSALAYAKVKEAACRVFSGAWNTIEPFLMMGFYIFVLVVTFMTAISLAVTTVAAIQNIMGMKADAHTGPSGGDARTTRLARMRVYRARANAVEEAIAVFKQELEDRGFPEVADKLEEVMRAKQPQLFANAMYETCSERFLEKNMVLLSHMEGDVRKTMQGLAVKGNLILLPWHYARFFKEEKDVKLTYRDKDYEIRVGKGDVLRCVDEDGKDSPDFALMAVPATVGCFQDILGKRHFVRKQEHQELDGMDTEMPSRREDNKTLTHLHHFKVRQENMVKYTDTIGKQEVEYVLPVAYVYGIDSKAGFCGAPLVKTGPVTHGSIFGMHVAKDRKGTSYAAPLDHEFVELNVHRALTSMRVNNFEDTPSWWEGQVFGVPTSEFSKFNPHDATLTVIPEGNMSYVATLNPGWAERVCNKTDILPSPIHGVFPVQTEPSVKSHRDPRLREDLRENPEFTPLNEGAKKYSQPTIPFNRRALELATRYIMCALSFVKPLGGIARKLTESEAINGIPGLGYSRLNMTTSAGWPHKRLRNPNFGSKGKRYLFEAEPTTETDPDKMTYIIRDPQLRKDVDEYEFNLKTYQRTFTVTYSNLKDERRSLAKIETGATRLFDCMGLPNTLMVRKYFGLFVATMNARCTEGHAAIGIDPESPDWTALYRRLNRFGGKVIAGDYKEWDGRLDPEAMMRAVDVINRWYQEWGGEDWSPGDDIARQILIMDVIRTYTIYGNTVVFKEQGLPSGMAITADLNSLVNWIYILTAFYTLRPSAEDTPDDLECSFYGDDHLVAPHPRIQAWFHFNALKDFFARHNIVYTDAMKRGGEIPDLMELANEATFLKRKFVPHPLFPNRMRAPIETKTVEELANWIRKTNRPNDAMMGNLQDLQNFAYHHGCDYYSKTMATVNNALRKLRRQEAGAVSFQPLKEDFEEMDERWLEKF